MNINLKILVEEAVSELLQETFRGFNFKKFKSISDPRLRIQYAEKHLPKLGEGSSRTAFGFKSGKVLKIAGSFIESRTAEGFLSPEDPVFKESVEKGLAQNEAEVEIFTNPKLKPVVVPIVDFDHQNYSWVIAEAVKEFKNEQEFKKVTNIPDLYLWFWILESYEVSDGNLDAVVKKGASNMQFWPKRFENISDNISLEEAEEYIVKNLLDLPIVKKALHLIDLGLAAPDLTRHEHWGVTSSGKIVALDYGLTDEVFDKWY